MFQVPGGPTPAGVAQLGGDAQMNVKGPSFKYNWSIPRRDPRSTTEYPLVATPGDAYDDIAFYKEQFSQGGVAGVGNNWVVPFEQSDAAYLRRKRDAAEKAAFDVWVNQKFDLADPAQNIMLQNIAPELYKRREEIIDQQQDLVSRYAKLRLRGAKSLEDLQFEWMIETNRVELPQGPIWNPREWRRLQLGNPADSQTDINANRQRFIAGFFSPLRLLTAADQNARQADTRNYFDIAGNPNAPFSNIWFPRTQAYAQAYQGNYPVPALYDAANPNPRVAAPAGGRVYYNY